MIELDEEQQIIQDSVKRYLRENCSFEQRQRQIESTHGFDQEQWQSFAELGWLGMAFPERYGGFGGTLIEAAVIHQQLGRALHCSPYLSTVIGAGTVLLCAGSAQQKAEYLGAIAEGTVQISCALHEKSTALNLADDVATLATRTDRGYELNGAKALVPYAGQVDHFIVSALLDDRDCLFLIPARVDGLRVTEYRMYDGSQCGDVELSGVSVDADALLPGAGADTVEAVADTEAAVLCLEAAGIMWSVHDETLEYLKTREQFGQKLGAFQALQHRIVDMYVQCQLADSLAWDAVEAVAHETDNPRRSRRVSAAKAYIGETGRIVGQEGVQLHGGIGMTDALPIGHYLKRLTAIDRLHGDSHFHRRRFNMLESATT